jgi:hypothetical protein
MPGMVSGMISDDQAAYGVEQDAMPVTSEKHLRIRGDAYSTFFTGGNY